MEKLILKEDGIYAQMEGQWGTFEKKLNEDQITSAKMEFDSLVESKQALESRKEEIIEEMKTIDEQSDDLDDKISEFNGVFDNAEEVMVSEPSSDENAEGSINEIEGGSQDESLN